MINDNKLIFKFACVQINNNFKVSLPNFWSNYNHLNNFKVMNVLEVSGLI